MDKELDELLCQLDGEITFYRMDKQYTNYINRMKLIKIQKEIQELWKINKGV